MIDSILPQSIREKLITLTNHQFTRLISSNTWVLDRLKPHHNKHIQLIIGPQYFYLLINDNGLPQFIEKSEGDPDLMISIDSASLPEIIKSPDNVLHYIHMQGNTALVNDLGFVAKNFRPDLEEILSHFVGNILAYRAAQFTKHTFSYGQSVFNLIKNSISEYMTEEKQLLLSRAEFNDWREALQDLTLQLTKIETQLRNKT
ncbi:hypothetical protein LHV13_06945 [Ferrovum sp. PN-J185]|uniref:ubiquinone biosynthesis accessory factor UbiJ n=1 Tax=Ferrovum sp. PN-J185 TaxID=1356306 RepID=UPI001E5F2E2E|nr:hypothetical protein [Ferrovum sp. PN-J185]MCC6068906.1 hypothetical protein [Ferrovum sp. PN-J185]